ncbi:eCIS core domain-containing protein [Aureibacter tunicatorum]|uniref:eCIS core domain-containing protein n=1 Tax=Aureibacter tunicatorum TaxID=866807 RepID=A0AAE3XLD6_9BACT|nr:DUF4157 domain-containing protein [Aureibacter tunicatorum]MDR6240036.1 hypothetical protein [Aureibacter tunicatorum]BDD04508.1 hypothetical protein AUTU_19910 [Aureibacter tunicatorum]
MNRPQRDYHQNNGAQRHADQKMKANWKAAQLRRKDRPDSSFENSNSDMSIAQLHADIDAMKSSERFQIWNTPPDQMPLQKKDDTGEAVNHGTSSKPNNTGLPDKLKTGVENLSGYSMDDVKVHYNSDMPAQLQAHAYAQGSDIHLASGQEKHLPHEAWHVVQQKQGRVKPTKQMKGKVNVNDDEGLEKEADVMGGKALQMRGKNDKQQELELVGSRQKNSSSQTLQGQFITVRPMIEQAESPGQEIALLLKKVKKDLTKFDHPEHVEALLNNEDLEQYINNMYESSIDHGIFDLAHDQELALFYYRLQREVNPTKQSREDEKIANQDKKKESDDWIKFKDEVIINNEEVLPIFKQVILGTGASAVYYLLSAFQSMDLRNSALIGNLQPWAGERGKKGVINHPMNMIAPDYQGGQLYGPDGLAEREAFSEELKDILETMPLFERNIQSVVKKGDTTKYYLITTNDGTFAAQKVVAAMGIGKHKNPGGITGEGQTEKQINRVMNMDEFKVAQEEGKLPKDEIKSIVVVGPNAAIDVMSTAIREGYEELTWIIGSGEKRRPAFLKGTDNEFVESRYDEVLENSEDESKLIKTYNGITVIKHDYLTASIGQKSVNVGYGTRASRQNEANEVGTAQGHIMVHGTGPDVGAMQRIFPDIENANNLEAIYDKNQRFNYDPVSPRLTEGKINIAQKEEFGDKTTVQKIENIIGSIRELERPSNESMPKKLPQVLGLQAKKDPNDETDNTSLEFIGGMASRLAGENRMKYTYISESFKEMKKTAPNELLDELAEEVIEEQSLVKDFHEKLNTFLILGEEFSSKLEAAQNIQKVSELKSDYNNFHKALIDCYKANNDLRRAIINKKDLSKNYFGILSTMFTQTKNIFDTLKEYYDMVKTDNYGGRITSHMGGAVYSLPKNVVLNDQLTSSRSMIEASENNMPFYVEQGVNFITSDATIIAAHMASGFTKIPPVLADYVTNLIIWERRHLPLNEAPLPRPNSKEPDSTFNLKQQQGFQEKWVQKLSELNNIF